MWANLNYLKNYHMFILCAYLHTYCHGNSVQYMKKLYNIKRTFPVGFFLILEIMELDLLRLSVLFFPLNEIQTLTKYL